MIEVINTMKKEEKVTMKEANNMGESGINGFVIKMTFK